MQHDLQTAIKGVELYVLEPIERLLKASRALEEQYKREIGYKDFEKARAVELAEQKSSLQEQIKEIEAFCPRAITHIEFLDFLEDVVHATAEGHLRDAILAIRPRILANPEITTARMRDSISML